MRLDKSGAYYIIDNGLYNVAFTGDLTKGNWDVAYEVPRPVKEKFRDPGKSRQGGITRIRWKVLSYGYFDRQKNLYQIIQNANAVTPVVSGNTISYPQIFNDIGIRYLCGNVSLKEEIVLSQTARNALPDPTKYGLSRGSSYLVVAMEFLLTPNNINGFARRQGGKTPIKQGNSFSFDGDDPIDFEDADSTLHFFFPKDYARAVNDSATGFANQPSVRRYFYSDRGKDYMLVGVPWDWINSAPVGDLIIDPTTSVATSADVWLEDLNNKNSTILLIGKAAGFNKKRTLIKFDVAGSGIPTGATVLNARLKMKYYGAINVGGSPWIDRWVQAHQLLKNWTETEADSSRRERAPDTLWAAPFGALDGTDAKATMESTVLFKQDYPKWQYWNLSNLTKYWLDNPTKNFGVILWATNENTVGYDLRMYSSHTSNPDSIRPKLEVTYSTDAATKTVYFLKDHLGSVRATVLDSAGAPVIGYDDYDPWGYPLALRTKAIPNAYLQGASKNKFTGKEYDDDLGLNVNYFGVRYYDPLTGRWMVRDPLAEKYPNLSPFVYVSNNPISAVDPNGRETYFVNGAGNDPNKWGYSQKIVTALQNAGISDVKHVPITQGRFLDQIYSVTSNSSDSRYITTQTRLYDDVIINKRLESNTATLVEAVNKDISAGNIGSGEQINLVGYSFCSVVTANAALELASKGTTVNNLVLIGSMVSTNSDLYKALSSNSNIKNIIRIDIPNDRFSNPKGIKDFVQGLIDALTKGYKLPHFIYALPENDKEREELAKQLYEAGVR